MSKKPAIVETIDSDHCRYSLQLNRWFLKPIGAWPSSLSTSKIEKIITITLIIICYSSIVFTLIPCLLHIFLDDESIYMKIKSCGPVSHWLVSTVSYTTLLLRQKDIGYCMERMRNDWRIVTRIQDQRVMLKNAQLGRYVAASCAIFMQAGVLGYCTVTAMQTEIIRVGNGTRVVHVLPCPVYKDLLNVDHSSTNTIVIFMQVWSSFIANSSTVGMFSLEAVLAAHACGQLNVLMVWIGDYVNQAKDKKQNAEILKVGMIVEHHLKTLDFISHIEDMMNCICFVEIFRCIAAVCALGYYILMEWSDGDTKRLASYFIIVTAISLNTFIICYIGEMLSEQWTKVGDMVYMTDWYYLPEKRISDLIMIIARSRVVIHMTAGKVIQLSLYTFGDVMKSAFVYMNVLRQVT